MKPRIRSALPGLALLLAMGAVPVRAQSTTSSDTTVRTVTQEEDDGTDWGWIGLLGLLGLLGLRRPKEHVHTTERVRVEPEPAPRVRVDPDPNDPRRP